MKILTYNVNGIRAALNKELLEFLQREDADVVCFQEIKANPDQFDEGVFKELGYHCYWFPAEKKGYSGVAILSKMEPKHVETGCGHEVFDHEGRVIRADFEGISVMSVYFPSGSSGDHRQDVKYEFLNFFYDYVHRLRQSLNKLCICGDYNICHREIDIHDPVSNKNSSGFLPEEREWMNKFFDSGFVDTFRVLHPEPDNYTWWSFRANARARNKGWRIDYISISDVLADSLVESRILPDDKQSDHCASYAILDI
ncbi:MAG: exodeoxyribonuclease III [Flavobacteriales bacterium]|nr:exodeoxyribonuclease III [Flavobacteriales bacterium]